MDPGAPSLPPAPAPSPSPNGAGTHDGGHPDIEMDYRSLLERIPAVTYLAGVGETARWYYVSPQIESMLGFTPEEWQADPLRWFRLVHPDDRNRVLEETTAGEAAGRRLRSEYRLQTRDGHTVWVRDEAVLVNDDAGEPLWQGFMIDITRRRETEDALNESEVRYRGLFDHVPVGLYRTNPDGELEDGNRALARIFGYPNKDSLLKANALDFYVDPADRDRWMAHVERGDGGGMELQLRRRDGSAIWIRDSARAVRDADDRVICFEGVIEDVTLRKQAEWEARQAHQQLSGWVNELEQRNRQSSLINEMGDMLQSCPTADEAYAVMAHWAEQLFSGRAGSLCVMAASRNAVEPVAVWGSTEAEGSFAPEDCWALRTGRPHVVDAPNSRLVCVHLNGRLQGASLCVPMMAQGEALGILHLESHPGEGSEFARDGSSPGGSLRQLAVAVAEHLALALANLKLRETLRTLSIRDSLTGMFNRRYMEESLERELRRAERRGHTVGVMMLDLDHFNRFNNTFGHQAGDALLQAFGELLRGGVRSEDIACRYGGEEFTLILPEAPLDVVLDRAERLRTAVGELRVKQRGQTLGPVTVSFGVAMYPDHGRTGEALIHSADVALYRAKAEGRDRVVLADSPEAPG